MQIPPPEAFEKLGLVAVLIVACVALWRRLCELEDKHDDDED